MVRISRNRINMESGRVDDAVLLDYGETVAGGGEQLAGSAYDVNINNGNVHSLILNAPSCAITLSNAFPSGRQCAVVLILKQDSVGGRTINWPASIAWASGTPPTLSIAPGRVDNILLSTNNAGLKWRGTASAQNFVLPSTVWTWGIGSFGRLGLNDILDRSSPVQVGMLANWTPFFSTTGRTHTAVIKTDSTLWVWGSGSAGRLGLNDILDRSSPTQVGTLADWASISADIFPAAIKTNGTLWTWGPGTFGNLGHNDALNRSSPVQVGTLTNWKVAGTGPGGTHVSAIKTDGTLWAWGAGGSGRLGNNDTSNRSSPVQVGTLTNWATVAGGSSFTAAIKTDGTLWTWGASEYGILGHNNALYRSSPSQVGTLTNWSSVSVFASHTAAIKTDGTLWTWGANVAGNLGHNDTVNRSSPAQVGTLADWESVSPGGSHSAAVKTDGTLWAWGSNLYGQVGDPTFNTRSSSPAQVGTLTNWIAASSGNTGVTAFRKP